MSFISILAIAIPVIILACIGAVVSVNRVVDWFSTPPKPTHAEKYDMDSVESTRQMPTIDTEIDIPEEDQEYLHPITVEVLKKLAFVKRMFPTNAMLIEHLAESLSIASEEFSPRKNNSEPPEKKNDAWLFVAAIAIRLYDEGTPHNCKEARDAFVSDGTLAKRRLEQWARRLNKEISDKVRRGVMGDNPIEDVTSHIQTVAGTAYTQDEIDDMTGGHDNVFNINQNK